MVRKIILIALCFLFITTYIPAVGAIEKNQSEIYTDCHIVSSGTITNRIAFGLFKIGYRAFIIYLNMIYKEDGITSICDEDGKLLCNKLGEQNIITFFFRGNYSYIKNPDSSVFISLDGLAIISIVNY